MKLKLSELIELAQAALEENGDMPVVVSVGGSVESAYSALVARHEARAGIGFQCFKLSDEE